MNEQFKSYLQNNSLKELSLIRKSDLHNHLGKGGNKKYIETIANVHINLPPTTLESLSHMDQ